MSNSKRVNPALKGFAIALSVLYAVNVYEQTKADLGPDIGLVDIFAKAAIHIPFFPKQDMTLHYEARKLCEDGLKKHGYSYEGAAKDLLISALEYKELCEGMRNRNPFKQSASDVYLSLKR